MRVALKPHTDTPTCAVSTIEVEVWRTRSGGLNLKYQVSGMSGDVRLPAFAGWTRADELWKQTCFEAFVRLPSGGYYELNFSPSAQWAAYRFDRYREGMHIAHELEPQVEMKYGSDFYELRAHFPHDQLAALAKQGPWQLALSAVIEETNGVKSYWALTHPPGKPDFHHADSFALELP